MDTSIVYRAIRSIRNDYFLTIGLISVLGQFYILNFLFSKNTPSQEVYLGSIIAAIWLLFLCIRYKKKTKIQGVNISVRKKSKILFYTFLFLSLIALLPAIYRILYLYTPLFSNPEEEAEPIQIGTNNNSYPFNFASFSNLKGNLYTNIYLDPLRSSYSCISAIDKQFNDEELTSLKECIHLGIKSQRARHILSGLRDSYDERLKFENENFTLVIKPTLFALQKISQKRTNKDPLLELGFDLIWNIVSSREWKAKFINSGILPTVSEWEFLEKEYPNYSNGLKHFLVEWIGLLQPFFHVTFKNTTNEPIEVSKISYKLKKNPEITKAELIGTYQTPRYKILLKEGNHVDFFNPNIILKPNEIKEIDMILWFQKPEKGRTYDLELQFESQNGELISNITKLSISCYTDK